MCPAISRTRRMSTYQVISKPYCKFDVFHLTSKPPWAAFGEHAHIIASNVDRNHRGRSLPATATDNEEFQRALSALQSGDAKEAELLFRAVLRAQPKHLPALNLLGILLMRSGRLTEAEDHFQLALAGQANSDATLYNYGLLLKRLNRPADAFDRFTQALKIDPSVAETWNNRGTVLGDLGRHKEATEDFDRAIAINSQYADAFCNKGKSLTILNRLEEALSAFAMALTFRPDFAEAWLGRANVFNALKRYEDATAAYDRARSLNLAMVAAHPISLSPSISKFHQGINYHDYLRQIHHVIQPSSYLEIGVETGATLGLAQCRAVAIDPKFQLQGNPLGQRAETHFFQMKSDEFFARYNLETFLHHGVDFAFLDGMHHFEYLLRDFFNTEKYSHADTIVALHDCYPVNAEIADRERNYGRRVDGDTRIWWAGDVWKLLPILRDFRPDLDVAVLDCPPTGLVVVRRLDPNSRVLLDAHDEIVAKYRDISLEKFGIERFREEFSTVDSRSVFQPQAMRGFLRVAEK